MNKYIIICFCFFLCGCDEGPKGTVKIIYQDEKITIYSISRGSGNGYSYVTDKGHVAEDEHTHAHPYYLHPLPRRMK